MSDLNTLRNPRNVGHLWDNGGGPGGAGNTTRGLTRSLDLGKEGLPMNGTREGFNPCDCGCGQDAGVYARTDSRKGWRKGAPRRFCHGHSPRIIATEAEVVAAHAERFWPRLDRSSDCWAWDAARTTAGDPVFFANGTTYRVHRLVFQWLNGPVDPQLNIVRTCGTSDCVNPEHLRVVDRWERAIEDEVDRFWSFVQKTDGCWLWTGSVDRGGYGYFRRAPESREDPGATTAKAHRFAYEVEVGPIPDGLFLLHQCDSPPCVNPAHLRPGTHEENMAEMVARGRSTRKKVSS